VGGNISVVKNGDRISIDAESNTITLHVSDQELETRRKNWKNPPLKVEKGSLYKYANFVSSASLGCVTDEF
jgi:dihydroxy-acid dehydratase